MRIRGIHVQGARPSGEDENCQNKSEKLSNKKCSVNNVKVLYDPMQSDVV